MSKILLSVSATLLFVMAGLFSLHQWAGLRFFESKTTTTTHAVIQQIEQVAKLQAVEYHGMAMVTKSHTNWANITSTGIFVGTGKVVATIDLERINPEITGDSEVTIKLPNVILDEPTLVTWEMISECHSFATAPGITAEQRREAYDEAQDQLRKAAMDNNIKAQALESAKNYLKTFIQALGYAVKFAETAA